MSVTAKALWYIESHLDGDLSLDATAAVAGVSRFHLSRAFSVSTGIALAAYIRGRRLSGAARLLARGAPDILTVALAAGYGSHEAFTRAFRQQFGLTPEQVRTQAHLEHLSLQEPIPMNQTTAPVLVPPRFVSSDARLIFGLGQRYSCTSSAALPAQWNRFVPHLGHIPGQVGQTAYGVIDTVGEDDHYEYVCGVEVTQFPAEPAEWTRLRLPAQSYAVFDHRGHISAIAATWAAVWERGIADAGRKVADSPALEVYGEQFDGRTGLGGVELWVPIER